MAELTETEWDDVLALARASLLMGRLAADAQVCGIADRAPSRVRAQFSAATALAAHHGRTVRWELDRIERALQHLPIPILLLKGAAYVAAGLPAARGRLLSDIDIMVPREALDRAEAALETAGWRPIKLDPYDQRYYRTWMHELPPLRHHERGTVVDVHHAILPPTARLKPDPHELWAGARRLDGGRLRVLAPCDMVLHSAAHLFHDGDLHRSLRNLVEINDLLLHFGQAPSFWLCLVSRAAVLSLGRPLFYALRYCRRLLGTPVPDSVMDEAAAHSPASIACAIMDRIVPSALIPRSPEGGSGATLLLYLRSHWLRMPPRLLLPHLARQSTRHLLRDA
jgi:hypothetical protein